MIASERWGRWSEWRNRRSAVVGAQEGAQTRSGSAARRAQGWCTSTGRTRGRGGNLVKAEGGSMMAVIRAAGGRSGRPRSRPAEIEPQVSAEGKIEVG